MSKVTTMVIRCGPVRKQPKAGDRKVVKGIEYIRRQAYSKQGQAFLVNNGCPVWEWVKA